MPARAGLIVVAVAVFAAPVAAPAAPTLAGAVIAVDPGHNGGNALHAREIGRLVDAGTLRKPCDTVGTRTRVGYTEASHNLDVARRLARRLRALGARVVLTRATNRGWGPCITKRAAIANRARADVAVSIHADGGPESARGFHVIYPQSVRGLTDDIAAASRRFALLLRREYRSKTGMRYANYVGHGGLARRSDLGGLNLSDVPKVFLEAGNMRNPSDANLLASSSFRAREAAALERAIVAFLRPRDRFVR
jgi:N-acetylmuramoyl-L-alanine amidase